MRRRFEAEDIRVIGINSPLNIDDVACRLGYDSTDGCFQGEVKIDSNDLIVNGQSVMAWYVNA